MKKKYTVAEFENLTGINKETLRYYRLRGFLHPTQDMKNHYYYYSVNDLAMVLFLRRQHDMSVPLSSVEEQLDSNVMDSEWIDQRLNEAIRQRDLLNMQIEWLKMDKNFYEDSKNNFTRVTMDELHGTKYDFSVMDTVEHQKLIPYCIHFQDNFTTTLSIKREDLTKRNKMIPAELKMGILEEVASTISDFKLPEEHTTFTKGQYLSMMLCVDRFDEVPLSALRPLLDYSEEHHLHFVSDVTSFLIKIHRDGDTLKYYFRLRVKVESE